MLDARLVDGPNNTHHVVDIATGDVLDNSENGGIPIWWNPRKKIKEPFVLLFQNGAIDLAKMKLPVRQMSVFLYLVGKLKYENYSAVSQKKISEELNMARSHVSTAIKALVERGLILRAPDDDLKNMYMLPNNILWKGNVDQLKLRKQAEFDESLQIPRDELE